MYRYEKLKDDTGHALFKYQVSDQERGLRLEQRARNQDSRQFWFWRNQSCYEFFAETHAYAPGTHDVPVVIPTTRLRDRASGEYAAGADLGDLRALIPEAIDAFVRLSSPRDQIDKVMVDAKF